MNATALDIAKPKASLKEEIREERRIGKMSTPQIIGYLMFRHRFILVVYALVGSNIAWIVLVLPRIFKHAL